MCKPLQRALSFVLTLVLIFQLMPLSAFAAEIPPDAATNEPNWEIPKPEEPDVVGEVEELRDHTSKQFRLSDGSFAAVNYGIPVHYLDEDNNWVDVDNTLTYSATAGQYMSVNGDEQRGFADTLTNGQPVLVSQYENYSVELTLLPMTYKTVRDEALVMDQENMADAAESEPAPAATDPSQPELSGEAESTSKTLGTDAEAEEEREATEAPLETEVTEPVPETTTPEETVPETTLPKETVPETTLPEESEPQITEPVETVPETTVPTETIPETTAPVETVPETTIPEETVIAETTEPEELEETVVETVMPYSVSAIVLNPGEASMYSSREDMPLSEQVLPKKMGSNVIYEGVFPGIDLMYENFGYNIKETILVNELQNSYSFSFLLTTDSLTPVLNTDGSITMTDAEGTVIYSIPAPYMYDAAGMTSYAVEYSLEAVGDDYILTVSADPEWIEDAGRILPVAIDPTITVECKYVSGGTLYTTHVVQGDPNLAHNGDNEQYIGYGMGYISTGSVPIRECQIFIHVADLPDIPEGCTMVDATLQMYNYGETGYSYIGNCTDLEIAAYPVTSSGPANGNYKSWIEGLTWNTKPAFDSNQLIDFAIASTATQGGYIQWDLTEQVEEWYENNTVNRTLALAGYESGSYSSSYCAIAVLKGYGTTNPPALVVKYRSSIGLESYYSSQTQNIGAAGVGYVGDYNGQLVLVKNLVSHASTVMPFSLNLVYNSYYATTRFKEARNTNMYFGNGWKLDAVQTLTQCTGDLSSYMLYIDGDGTYHYFKKNSAGTQWDDEDGLDMTVKKASITSTSGSTLKTNGYAISNGQGDQLLFYNGLLVQQKDANGNTVYYLYNSASDATSSSWLPTGSGDKLTKVIQRNDGASSDISLATLTYNSSTNRLEKVTDRAGYVYTLSYDTSGKLKAVTSTEKQSANYSYSGNYLNEAIDVSGNYKIDYDFENERISAIKEYGSSNGTTWTAGTKIIVTGSRDKTTYRFPGKDGTSGNTDDILTTYLFDDEGRTINSNSTNANQSVIYGASTGAYATSNGTSNTNNHLVNSATIGTAAINLITNGGFETENSSTTGLAQGWTYTTSATSGMAITMKNDGHRTGNYALKTWFNSTTTGTVSAKQTVSGLVTGEIYTFSAYVNTTGVTSFGTDGGVYLSVTGCGTAASDIIDYATVSTIDSGWTRIFVTFTAEDSDAVLNIIVKNAVGVVYADDCQMEKDDAPSNVNLLVNGAMESTAGWNLKTPANTSVQSGGLGGSKAMGMTVDPTTHAYIVQTVPVNLPYTETYVLSGWAKADALPNNQPQLPKKKIFTLKAELYYTDGTYDEYFLPFSAEIDNEWQFASMVLVPKQQKTVTKILVLCCYFQNTGTALFDNISLLREPAQTMKYNDNGYLMSVVSPGTGSDASTYSGGNLIETVTPGNGTFTFSYDAYHNLTQASNGSITQKNTYDTMGNAKNTVLSGTGTTETITTSATYTTDGNHMSVYTDMLGSKAYTAYTNDFNKMYGIPSSAWNHNNIQTVFSYYKDGRKDYQYLRDKDTLAEIIRLTYTYDTSKRLISIARTGASATQTYSLTYNDFDQVLTTSVGDRTLSTNTYNTAGVVTRQKWGNGDYVDYTYDALGRVKSTVTESGKDVVYAYNADGQPASTTLDSTLRYDYLYDSLGRLIRSSRHDSGELMMETRIEFDDSNRLSKQYINLIDRLDVVGYTYNGKGLLTTMTHDWLPDLTYTYDGLQRLSTRKNSVMSQTFSYLTGTNLISNLSYDPGTSATAFTSYDIAYTYDELGNIETVDAGSVFYDESYVYDDQNQLTNATINGVQYEYSYDAAGNIKSAKNQTGTHTYLYEDDKGWSDLLTSFDGGSISYDASGNPTSYYNGTRWSMTWKNGNELTNASSTSAGHTISYAYDGDGLRTSKTVDGVTYNYIYASGKLMRQTWGSNVIDFIYDDRGSPYAMKYNETTYYYMLNLQGDVIAIMNSAGTRYGVYWYDAWGNIIGQSDSSILEVNPLRYRGYVYDAETGFYYLQSRYYDPAIGRFINADSFASTGQSYAGYNMFAYCENNPVNSEDPDGETPETVFDIISLGASIAGVAVDPWNPWAWLELLGDAVDVAIPLVGGLGEAVRVLKALNAIDETVDAVQIANNTMQVIETVGNAINNGDEFVYKAFKTNSTMLEYVGITNDFGRRETEWKKQRQIVECVTGVDRDTARCIEQTVISIFGRNGNTMSNIRNSIGPNGRLKKAFKEFFDAFF